MRVELDDLDNEAVTVLPGSDCFYCGETIVAPPYVIWQGSSCAPGAEEPTQIGLHIGCAEKLADHLRADSQPRH